MNDADNEQLAQETGASTVEYQVVGMIGHVTCSGLYSTVDFGDDARLKAIAVQQARGGRLLRRYVVTTPWEEMPRAR